MPRPNYPQEFGSEWKQVKRRVQQAFTAANSRIRFGRIEAADISVQGGGSVNVQGGGDINVTDGSLVAADGTGDVFRIDPTVPEIFMRPELISAVARQVIANSVFSANADGQINVAHTSFSFVDPSDAAGPTIADVEIGSTGRAIVFATANIGTDAANAGTEIRSWMSYEVSGASSVSPDTGNAVAHEFRNDVNDNGSAISASRASLLTGLNEGLHTFDAKYQVTAFGTDDEGIFLFRNLTVIAF